MSSGEGTDVSSLEPGVPPSNPSNFHRNDQYLDFPVPFPAVRPRKQKELPTSASSDNEESEEAQFTSTSDPSWEDIWSAINEKRVHKIDFHIFYQPRTLTLLVLITVVLVWIAFAWDDRSETRDNIARGLVGVVFLFLSIGLLVFPNGPFTRPHPLTWKVVFGLSMLYLLCLSFVLFQHDSDVRYVLGLIDPHLTDGGGRGVEKPHPLICVFMWKNIGHVMNIATICSFLGWVFKAMLVQHYGMLWTMNVVWELTQVFLSLTLPDYPECWWDSLLFDIPFCNGFGIHLGIYLSRKLEMTHFQQQSIKKIKGARGKLKRVFLQFVPAKWHTIQWPAGSYSQATSISILILLFHLSELNTVLLQEVFNVPSRHFLSVTRQVLLCLVAAPSVRQYYTYVLDSRTSRRLGTQSWICIALLATELLIWLKFGLHLVSKLTLFVSICWTIGTVVFTVVCVGLITTYTPWSTTKQPGHEKRSKKKKKRQKRVYSVRDIDRSD